MSDAKGSTRCLALLSQLLLGCDRNDALGHEVGAAQQPGQAESISQVLSSFSRSTDFRDVWTLATSNHVILRAFPSLRRLMAKQKAQGGKWISMANVKEKSRV